MNIAECFFTMVTTLSVKYIIDISKREIDTYINRDSCNDLLHKEVEDMEPLEVVSGKAHFNFRCHLNSFHEWAELKNNGIESSIVSVLYINDRGVISIHFLNLVDGVYIDNTIGNVCEFYKYYLIEELCEDDIYHINDYFINLERELVNKNLNFNRKVLKFLGFKLGIDR